MYACVCTESEYVSSHQRINQLGMNSWSNILCLCIMQCTYFPKILLLPFRRDASDRNPPKNRNVTLNNSAGSGGGIHGGPHTSIMYGVPPYGVLNACPQSNATQHSGQTDKPKRTRNQAKDQTRNKHRRSRGCGICVSRDRGSGSPDALAANPSSPIHHF